MTKTIITQIRTKVYGNQYALNKITEELTKEESIKKEALKKETYVSPCVLRLGKQEGKNRVFYYAFPKSYCPV